MVSGFFKIKSLCFIVTTIKIATIFCSETIYSLWCDRKNMYAFQPSEWACSCMGNITRVCKEIKYIFLALLRRLSNAKPSFIHLSICPSVCPSANLYSNRISSHSFHFIFPVFGLNADSLIVQKSCGSRIFIFSFLFFLWIFNYKNRYRWEIWRFLPFSKNVFNMRPRNVVYRHIVGTSMCMWDKFSSHFGAQIEQK